MKNKIVTGTFIIIIAAFSIISVVSEDKTFSQHENRYLTLMPDVSVENILDGSFQSEYEEYLLDQFPGRDQLISINTSFNRLMLKMDVNGVYFAKDGYLIEKFTNEDLDEEQKDKNVDRLTNFVTECGKSPFLKSVKVLMVPTKAEILSDKMPFAAPSFDQAAFLSELTGKLGDEIVINASDTLMEHADEYIYYKTDHHYTTLGAYYTYTAWAESMGYTPREYEGTLVSNDFYGTTFSKVNINTQADSISLYTPSIDKEYGVTYNENEKFSDTLYDMDKLDTWDKYAVFMGGNYSVVSIENPDANPLAGSLLIVKDSYANSFVPFVAEHYKNVYLIDLRYYNGNIRELIQENEITDVLVLYNITGFVSEKSTTGFIMR